MSADPRHDDVPAGSGLKLALAWALVGLPLLWGVWQTLKNALKLFG